MTLTGPPQKPLFRERLERRGTFAVAVELVTSRGVVTAQSSRTTVEMAQQLAADSRIDVISITDNPGGNAMLAPDTPATEASVEVDEGGRMLPLASLGGCTQAGAMTVVLTVVHPTDVELSSPVGGALDAIVRPIAGTGSSMPRTFVLSPGQPEVLDLSDVGYDTVLTAPGAIRVCA